MHETILAPFSVYRIWYTHDDPNSDMPNWQQYPRLSPKVYQSLGAARAEARRAQRNFQRSIAANIPGEVTHTVKIVRYACSGQELIEP